MRGALAPRITTSPHGIRRLITLPGKILVLLGVTLICGVALATGVYQEPEDFLSETFTGNPPAPEVVWLTGDRKTAVNAILGHDYSSLRVRYWRDGLRSAWVLEEIGKDQPITIGVVVNGDQIERIKVLVFRESRGWEIRHPFFADQFTDARLDRQRELDQRIDGISGATLSVRAMKKLAKMALYLDTETDADHVPQSP